MANDDGVPPTSTSTPPAADTAETAIEFSVDRDFDHRSWPILLVEDNPDERRRFKNQFGLTFTVHPVSGDEAKRWFTERKYAVVIASNSLKNRSGASLLAELASIKPYPIRLLLSDEESQQSQLQAINHARAYGYLTRPWRAAELNMMLRRAVERYALDENNRRLVSKLKEERLQLAARVEEQTRALRDANKLLRSLAISDGLTGLFNHRYFQERLKQEVGASKRYSHSTSLMLLDLDHFKTYNDTLGHPQGDLLLREVATLLRSTAREVDLVARYGGDEFAIAMPRTSKGSAVVLAERIRAVIAGGAFEDISSMPEGRVTVSIGVATFPEDGSDNNELLQSADDALYHSKKSGRDRVSLAEGFKQGTAAADREGDFHLLVDEDGATQNLTPRPIELKTLETLLGQIQDFSEILEDGDTVEHPSSVPNLGPKPQQLTADIVGEE